MNINTFRHEQKMRKIFLLLVAAMFIIIFSLQTFALTFAPLSDYTGEETKTIAFNFSLSEYNGTTSFSSSPFGSVVKVNNSHATFTWTPGIGQAGNHTIIYTATDDLATVTIQNKITIVPLNNPPVITSFSAGAQTTSQVTLSVSTNRACICKYSTSNVPFNNMPFTFAQINPEKTEHEGKTPSLSQGTHLIYASCTDTNGNYMLQPSIISLTINLRPSAKITLDPETPLRQGTVSIDLTTTEPLISAPELKYSFDDDSTLRNVALIGSGTEWQGYIIIKDTDSERVGSFTYKGYDLNNLEGNEITDGKLFLIDTEEPSAIESVSIENTDEKIKLTWEESDSDNIDNYKIFRRESSGGVETVDYYKSTDKLYLLDSDVEYSEAYYYRVCAVDNAGNEGPLSKEVFITHIPSEDISEDDDEIIVQEKLDSKLEYVLQDKIISVEKTLMDISKAEETLSRLLGSDNIDSVEILGVLQTLSDNKNSVNDLKNVLESLREQELSEKEFNDRISEIFTDIDNIWQKTPIEVRILDSSTYQEFTNDEKTRLVVSDYLKEYYTDLSVKDLDTSLNDAMTLQDLFIVNVRLIKGEVKYPLQTKPFAIVKKTLDADGISGKSVLFEYLPENIANPESIIFSEQPFYKENIVFWNVDDVSGMDISYVIESDINLADLKTIKSILFVEQDLIDKKQAELEKLEDGNSITGGVTGSRNSDGNILLVLIVAGIMIVSGLFAYYVFWSEEEGKGNDTPNTEHNSSSAGRFNIAKSLFRKKEESIIPDAHRRIVIEKPENEIHHNTDSYVFQNFNDANSMKQEIHSSTIQSNVSAEQETSELPKKTETDLAETDSVKSNSYANRRNSFEELSEVQEKLRKVKARSNIGDIEDFDELRNRTYKIKNLCEEIEEQSIMEFTNKTKENLEKSLLYIAKYAPPVKTNMSPDKVQNSRMNEGNEQKKEQVNESKIQDEQQPIEHTLSKPIAPFTYAKHPAQHSSEEKEFIFSNGSRARTIAELKQALFEMNDSTFRHHVTESKNDFATWIGDVFKNYELAHRVRFAASRDEIINLLNE